MDAVAKMDLPSHVYIVGAGGVTSYFLPVFLKTIAGFVKNVRVHIIDGDILEARNLDRQLFSDKDVGRNKAESLASMYKSGYRNIKIEPKYFSGGYRFQPKSLVFGFVDNHTARKEILDACDRFECNAILAANEFIDAQSMYYCPEWRGSKKDPRVRYPEILTDETENPLRPQSCAGEEARRVNPQLAIANASAASHASQLFWFYVACRPWMEAESRPFCPVEHTNNFNKIKTMVEGDYV